MRKHGNPVHFNVARLRDTVLFSFKDFLSFFFLDSVQNSRMLEQKLEKKKDKL